MASLNTRMQTTIKESGGRIFLLSGFEDKQRQQLAEFIKELGGLYLETEAFKPNCSHIVCGKLSRSEKFLGGCATGKWILHPHYITVSRSNAEWQKEEDYEWSNFLTSDISVMMAEAARRWRFHYQVYLTMAFSGWKTAVVVHGHKKDAVYKRLLLSGGAEVYHLKLPVKNPGKVMNLLTYVFVSEKSAVEVLNLMEYGILCLKPEYIGDYLLKDPPPDPLDYLVQPKVVTSSPVIDVNTSVKDSPNSSYSQREITLDQVDVACSQEQHCSSQDTILYTMEDNTSSGSSQYCTPSSTPSTSPVKASKSALIRTKDPSPGISPLVAQEKVILTRSKSRYSITPVTSDSDLKEDKDLIQAMKSSSNLFQSWDDIGTQSTGVHGPSRSTCARSTSNAKDLSDKSNSTDVRKGFVWKPSVFSGLKIGKEVLSNKRKYEGDHLNASQKCKKLKSEQCSGSENMNIRCESVPFSSVLTNMINQCFDEETECCQFKFSAIDMIASSLSYKQFPQASTISYIMRRVLQESETCQLSQKAYNVLMRCLQTHPPLSSVMVDIYMDSFLPSGLEGVTTESAHHWDFIRACIEQVVNVSSGKHFTPREGHLQLLQYIVSMLEQNFQYNMMSRLSESGNINLLRRTMVSQILWPRPVHVSLNNKCRQLMTLYWDLLAGHMEEPVKGTVVKCLTSLISMVTSLCHVIECGYGAFYQVHIGEKTEAFVQEIARAIGGCHISNYILGQAINSLQPSVVCLQVCCILLSSMDDYLILGEISHDNITLTEIVSKYLYLLPRVSKNNTQSTAFRSPHSKISQENPDMSKSSSAKYKRSLSNRLDVDTEKSSNGSSNKIRSLSLSLINKINRKNVKGETALHLACMKNNVHKVRELLKVPGIDVNAKDNAGWTPMHEACNHGNIDCIVELLSFVPAKTVKEYFCTGEMKIHKVDLLACSDELITPLHDAAMNGRREVCQLLLQHGGSSLLNCKTILGYTPIDLAITEDLRDLLLSYQDKGVIRSLSQESNQSDLSQDSPSDYLYRQVFDDGVSYKFSTQEEVSKYITLVTMVIKRYLDITEIRNIQTVQNPMSENTDPDSTQTRVLSCDRLKQDSLPFTYRSATCNITTDTEPRKPAVNQCVKNDLKVLKKFRKYINRFENHIKKISNPEDRPFLKLQLTTLHCIADHHCITNKSK